MSWLYLPELVADYSQADCLAGEPSAPSKSTSIASESSCSDSETDTLKSSLSGMTCEPSTATPGVVESMSLPPAFLASLSALPASDKQTPTNGMDGRRRHEYLTKYDHNSRCWRTSQACLFQDTLDEFLETWPNAAFVFDGMCYPLPESEHLIDDDASGLLPTPTSHDSSGRGKRPRGKTGNHHLASLEWVVMNQWATPAARDWRSGKASQATMNRNSRPLSEQVGGSLNPPWVEWLMGWPIGWTDLEPLATDKFQQWLSAHGMS